MTTNLERIARSVIEAAEKARTAQCDCKLGSEFCSTQISLRKYKDAASDSADKLARACLVMMEALNNVSNNAYGYCYMGVEALSKADEIMKGVG